jgi:hypothetical protein
MSNVQSPRSNWLVVCLSVAALMAFVIPSLAQAPVVPAVHAGNAQVTGVPVDWSHFRLVFSDPGTEQDAIKNGRYDDWWKITSDPRYVIQQMRRGTATRGPSEDDIAFRRAQATQFAPANWIDSKLGPGTPTNRFTRPRFGASDLKKDWSSNLTTSAIMPNTYPAKFSFSTTGTPSCANDYVLYPTGATGSATAATVVAFNNIYPGATSPGCGSTTPEKVYWAYNTGAGAVTTSPILSLDGTKAAFIQTNSGVANLVLVKWLAGSAGATCTSCTVNSGSAVVTATTGTPFTANMVGAQYTETGVTAGTYILSYQSGTQVTLSATAGSTHTTTGTIGATNAVATPATLASQTAGNFLTCAAPCMYSVALSGNTTGDTFSSPFYDYTDDVLYVGDNASTLHKFTGVFTGTPTEVTPVSLAGAGNPYTVASPVYDSLSGCVFVGDSEGYLYSVNSGRPGTVCTSGTFSANTISAILGNGAANEGIFDAPLVDQTAARVYVFVADSKTVTGGCAAGDGCVVQYTTTITSGEAPPAERDLGTGGANYWQFSGSFDNTYYTSGTPTSPSGNIWAIGNNGGTAATLYQVPINSNAFGTVASTAVGSTRHGWGSPVTEFYNGTLGTPTDDIYFSVNHGTITGSNCTSATGNGCVIAYNVATGAAVYAGSTNFAYPNNTNTGCWGTSAFIIDNGTNNTDTSNVYFEYFGGNTPSTLSAACTTATITNTNGAYSESQGTTF